MSGLVGPSVRRGLRAWRDAGFPESLVALLLSATTSLVAGLTLASITGTLEELPGLLLLVPGAIGMRGNIFGALGSRLGTSIHAGTFGLTRRLDTVVGQNVAAAVVLTVILSAALGVLAKLVAVLFGVTPVMTTVQFVTVSMVGGVVASVGVLVVTVALAAVSAGRAWDLDNVVAPLVTATGDVLTLPALVLGAWVAQRATLPTLVVLATVIATVAVIVGVVRSELPELRSIVRESVVVLGIAAVFDLVAGVTIEKRLDSFVAVPALLVLVPGFFESSGSLGGILSSRLATKFHLGMAEPTPWPGRVARGDIAGVAITAVPVFALVGTLAHLGATLTSQASPGLGEMIAVALLGGAMAVALVAMIAYAGTVGAMRLGTDPDSVGIPLVTSALDVVGAFAVVLAALAVGVM